MMQQKHMGEIIVRRRKELGMTQKELADTMQVTDKAVSKWERNLSCPDIGSIPALARTLEISVEELMDGPASGEKSGVDRRELTDNILKAVSLAMGVALVALSVLGELDLSAAAGMAGIGLTALAIRQFLN